jgi:predicted nucleic acid-binding protein
LSLAVEIKADVVILDDLAARRSARLFELRVIGTLGLLLRAKHAGLIAAVRPKLDVLRTLPFRIGPSLWEEVLRDAGEL